ANWRRKAGGGIDVVEQAMLLLHEAEVVVAHAQIQSEATGDAPTVLNVARVGIFKGVAVGLAGCLHAAAVGHAIETIAERVEGQGAAENAVEELRNRGTAEFVAEFDVVLAGLPRNIVDVVPVGVDALAGMGLVGTQLRQRAAGWTADVEDR